MAKRTSQLAGPIGPTVLQGGGQTDDTMGVDALVQAMAARQYEEQAGRARERADRRYPGWGSVVSSGLNSAIAGRQDRKALEATKQAAIAKAESERLLEQKKVAELHQQLKTFNPNWNDQQALHAAKMIMGGHAKLEDFAAPEGPTLENVNALQNQINMTVGKEMKARSDAARDIYEYAQGSSGFGDHALIFRYMKFLDPTSTVREGEFATVEQTGSVPDMVVNMYNKAISGQKLRPEQRQEIVNATLSTYPAYIEDYANQLQPFIERAGQYGVDTKQLSIVEPWMPPSQRRDDEQPKGEAAPAKPQEEKIVLEPGKEYLYDNGKFIEIK
jgi:hypothetical protein